MKPVLILIDSTTNQSISIRKYLEPKFQNPWHFHKEIELVLILKGKGTCFIGDYIGNFCPGDLIMLGNNLPHMLKNRIEFEETENVINAEAIVIHFSEYFIGKDYLQTPEMRPIMDLLNQAKRGIKVSGSITAEIAEIMNTMLTQTPFQRILELLSILQKITEGPDLKLLSSISFHEKINKTQNSKLDRVYEFVMNNFSCPISLDEISDIAYMNKTAFCKYFKDRTQKTFNQFLTEIRINYAKRLLMEGDRQISEIAYECGYNNLSNFNRQFRKLTNTTPGSFQSRYKMK
ncbi:MAG: AraC family transcriptional regulator [Bacteroidetes bacterium]|nr:MAG: AraC family transcriptional regulator [Bacteroidota bacterium]